MSPEIMAQLERDKEFKAWYDNLHSAADTDYTKRRREEDDYYDADQAQKDDEEDYERGYDDDGLPLGEEKIEVDADTKFELPLKHLIQKHVKEVLTKRSKVGKYIEDFSKSDAPQFKGKSKDKKREMAVAAYLAKQDKK